MTTALPRHILAGDDSPEILTLLREILEGEGYRVSMTAGALDLDQIKRAAPDLVILDHMIEEGAGSGWELLHDLRQDPQTAELPVVVCTGAINRVQQNEDLLRRLGAQVVLKPFDIDRLLEAVNRAWTPPGLGAASPFGSDLDPSPAAD